MLVKFQNRDTMGASLRDFCGYTIWRQPQPTRIYAIGVDVAEGLNGDASVASVLDVMSGLHVCNFWSNVIDPDNFAAEIYKLGNYYNKAHMCVEANNHGRAVLALLGGSVGGLAYPNLYKRIRLEEYTQKRTRELGFSTTRQTKPRIIANLNGALRDGELITFDKYTIQELGSFVRDERTGREAAKGSAKDDRVIALALAWEQARLLKESLKNTDESYTIEHQQCDPMTGFLVESQQEQDFF